MFIGREQELNFLNSRYHSKNAELIFLYGRYRIGKTETLHEFCKDKEHIFYSCQECPDNIQLRNFSQSLFNHLSLYEYFYYIGKINVLYNLFLLHIHTMWFFIPHISCT